MLISFKLSMPNNNSWNGKWSGDGIFYAIVRSVRDKQKANEILKKGYFHYNFGDGWSAGITANLVDSSKAAKIRRKSKGFCGYDWMVDSILIDGTIITRTERSKQQAISQAEKLEV